MREKFNWVTKDTEIFLERGYLEEGVTPIQRVRDISDKAEHILNIPGFSEKFFDYMSKGWYSLSSPVWSNFGLDRGLPISCFGSYIEDSVESILYTVSEVGVMSKMGGGTSGYFGKIRPRGSKIKNNGTSNGSFPFARMFDTTIDVISQGTTRKGQFAGYIDIEHEDIEEWLEIQLEGNPIQLMYYAICVGNSWLEEMKNGDRKKRKIWAKVIQCRTEIGVPYILFKDNVNENTVDVYKDKDMTIHASNLCMTGDQRVVTSRGYLTAKELFEQGGELTLFNGNNPVESSEMKLREENVEVYKITLENGLEHKVTAYHGIPLIGERGEITRVECRDLKIGDKVAIQVEKGLFGIKSMQEEAFLLGLYQSDGTQHKDYIMLDVWENDFDILQEVQEKFNTIHEKYGCNKYEVFNQEGSTGKYRSLKPPTFINCKVNNGDVSKKRLSSKTLKKALNFEKGYIPNWIWESDEKTQWEYVRGLLIADGTVFMGKLNENPIQIAYSDINRDFLMELQILFNNLGLQSSIRLLRKAGVSLLPDGKGGKKYYNTKDCYRLIISNKNSALVVEKNTKFLSRKSITLEDRVYRDNSKKGYKIESISFEGREDVYCPTVFNDEHIFVAQGFKTFNCSEIMLPSNNNESFVCCLSSMNLLHYDEWKDTDAVETLVYFLDAVMSEFIEKTEGVKFMERANNFAKNHRALGLGVLGWHSLLQSKMVPFDSFDAMMLNNEIFKNIQAQAYIASEKLSKLLGEPPLLKGYGRRNTTLMAIAPTKSSSFILGQVSQGIEPIKSNYYIQDLAKIKTTFKNPLLLNLLRLKAKDTPEVWESILLNDGSVKHLDFLTSKEIDVFKTFSEISQLSVIQQAGQRQKYICQSQSLNLMIHPSTPTKDVNKLHLTACELGVKSLYYQHSVNAAQEFNRSLMECSSCEG